MTSNSNASKYLKNNKEVIFSENPYVSYRKDIIFPPNTLVYIFIRILAENDFFFLSWIFLCIWIRCQCCHLCVLWENSIARSGCIWCQINQIQLISRMVHQVREPTRTDWNMWVELPVNMLVECSHCWLELSRQIDTHFESLNSTELLCLRCLCTGFYKQNMQKNLFFKRLLNVIFNIVHEFDAEKSARSNQMLFVTKLVVSRSSLN